MSWLEMNTLSIPVIHPVR